VAERLVPRGQAVSSTWPEASPPRLFDGNGLGFVLADPPQEIQIAFSRLEAVLRAYRDLARDLGAGFAVVLFPQRYQVQPRDWQAMIDAHALVPACFDLEAATRRILEICERAAIPCRDPTPGMALKSRRVGAGLYLPNGDMHWNAAGHRVLFEEIRDWVESLEPVSRAEPVG
jgi:hypothetical protein